MRFDGKVALVTGAASGIGRATAMRLAREGARLVLVDRDERATRALAADIGDPTLALCGDVARPEFADRCAQAALEAFGRIDVLITAAGFSVGGTVLTTTPADWDAVFGASVGGTWLFARACIPAMQRQGGGAIVAIASQLALAGGRGNSAYVAAKGAVLSLTRTMALDFAADGIRVNAVAPGAIDTPMLARSFARHADPDAVRESSRARHPLGRFGTADEIAAAIAYLAGDEAGFTTGTTLAVDGGWLAA